MEVCKIVELEVGVAEDSDVGLRVGDDEGVWVGEGNPKARVAYVAPVGLIVKFAMF